MDRAAENWEPGGGGWMVEVERRRGRLGGRVMGGGRAHLSKVASADRRRDLAQQWATTGPICIRPEAPCQPWCRLEVGPCCGVSNQIRKVVEEMHWRMHDEPSFTIASHRGKMCHKVEILIESRTVFGTYFF